MRLTCSLILTATTLTLGCSSGLEGVDAKGTRGLGDPQPSTNLRFMFDPCLDLSSPVTEVDVTGAVLPIETGTGERPVAFFAFVTASPADDADGAGPETTPLDPDAPPDSNGAPDVFLAVVDANSIDQAAFVYSIGGTMRHPRCVTCHQMNIDVVADPGATPPLPFLNTQHFPDGGGEPPLNAFDDKTCSGCHFDDWFPPGPTFDLRAARTEDLFIRAQVPPAGIRVHFSTDPRVLWALGSGASPFGEAADDDYDGIVEPEDTDGTRRHAPGGTKAFLRHLDDWLATADPVSGVPKYSSAPDAVQDIVLVSRNDLETAAGNDQSRAPSLVYLENPGFVVGMSDPDVTPYGFVLIAYQSDATDMDGGDEGFFTDIFRSAAGVFEDADGRIDLRYVLNSQVHVSETFDGNDPMGHSTEPDMGLDDAFNLRIAFLSEAMDLIAGFGGDCRQEAYISSNGDISLLSHVPGDVTMPGNAGAANVDLSPDGNAVAFESDATNLVNGDNNGKRDVFFSLPPFTTNERASIDTGGGELAGHSTHASVFHEAGEAKIAFACQNDPLPPIAAIQCPDVVDVLDADLDCRIGSMNSGSTTALRIGTNGNGEEFRSLVRFDLSGIPPGSTINSAELTLTVNMIAGVGNPPGVCTGGTVNNTVNMFVVTSDWDDDATFVDRMTGVPWNTIGGDFSASVRATQTMSSLVPGTVTWSSGNLAADVQGWLDAPATNFGWLMDGSNSACSVRQLDSLEQTNGPSLRIEYSPPPPLLPRLAGTGGSSIFLRDTATGTTTRIDRIVSPRGTVDPVETFPDGMPGLAEATNPVISPYGNAVIYESMAQNQDFVRPFDLNREMDVMLADLQMLDSDGFILPYALSVTPDGGFGDGASHSPIFGGFTPPTDQFPLGLAVFATQARNLGDADPADLNEDGMPDTDNFMLNFLDEGGAVVANFEAEPATQGMNRDVRFISTSSGSPTSFEWDFGDGATSTRESPRHRYTTPGSYTVSLTASGRLGTDSRTRIDLVHILGAVVAQFRTTKDISEATPTQGTAVDVPHTSSIIGAIDDGDPSSRLLFDLDSSDSTEQPDNFRWTLTTLDAMGNPTGNSRIVSNEASPTGIPIDRVGSFELELEATGPGGAGSAAQRIDVFQEVAAAFTSNPAPLGSVGMPIEGDSNLDVQFTSAATGDLVAAGSHSWDFGDGSMSNLDDPSHTFGPGVFDVTLTVFGEGGDVDKTAVQKVVSLGAVTALFSAAPSGGAETLLAAEGIAGAGGLLSVDFKNDSRAADASPLFFNWNFGFFTGQETATDPTGIGFQLASLENVQTFDVTLVASKNNPAPNTCLFQPVGTCDSRTAQVKVFPEVSIGLAASPSFSNPAIRPPHTVQLSSAVLGDGAGTDPMYRWLRSEPNGVGPSIEFSNELSPLFEFPAPGNYEVALLVETNGPFGTRQQTMSLPINVTVDASTLTEFLAQAVEPASGAKCTNCHKGASPPAGLNWVGTPSEIFNRIVEDAMGNPIMSTNCNSSRRRIEPGDPTQSVVWNVLLNPTGPLCPINMRVNLPGNEEEKNAHVDVLASWISSGAPNN